MNKAYDHLRNVLTTVVVGALLCGSALLRCTSPIEHSDQMLFSAKVEVFSAEYLIIGDRVRLSWQRPSVADAISHYVLYRYQSLDTDGDPLDLRETVIDSGARMHHDVLEPGKGQYSYYIVPFKVAGGDTVGGQRSEIITITGGAGISFTINDGASSVVRPECTLMLRDAEARVAQVRFTQKVQRFFYNLAGDSVAVSTHDVKRLSPDEQALLALADMFDLG
ncbi:MAG: hypothetical protein GF331_01590, partial [Chitinivibrionales bacterium]|nr:hypothetical protein [Chitinivibrionales bacterium]